MTLITTLLMSAALAGQPAAEPQPAAGQQTVAVNAAPRVEILNQAGSIEVRTGAAQQVRMTAPDFVIESSGNVVEIRPKDPRKVQATKLVVLVPEGSSLLIRGWYPSVDVRGPVGQSTISTREGTVVFSGGRAGVVINANAGSVEVADVIGRVEVSGATSHVTIHDVKGDLLAETTSGAIEISNVQSGNLDVSSISGGVTFTAPVADNAHYQFSSHTGAIALNVPANASATVTTFSLRHIFSATPPLTVSETTGDTLRRRVYRLDGGRGAIEIRTFEGPIQINRKQ